MTAAAVQPSDRRSAVGWKVSSSAGNSLRHVDGRSITTQMVGNEHEKLFTQTFLPSDEPRGGVVVCSPVYAEAIRNERREFIAAVEWAARGVAVIRFHYRGTGHSSAVAGGVGLEDLVADAVTASNLLLSQIGALHRLVFMGTRFGAIVAANASVHHPHSPLVLWQPITNAERFYREVFRAKMMGDIAQGRTSGRTRSLLGELENRGWIDVVGHRVGHRLYQSAIGASLTSVSGLEGRSILLVQMSPRSALSADLVDLVQGLEQRGCSVRVALTVDDEAWWFGRDPNQEQLTPDAFSRGAATATGEYLATVFGDAG